MLVAAPNHICMMSKGVASLLGIATFGTVGILMCLVYCLILAGKRPVDVSKDEGVKTLLQQSAQTRRSGDQPRITGRQTGR